MKETTPPGHNELDKLTKPFRREILLLNCLIVLMVLWLLGQVFIGDRMQVSHWISTGVLTGALVILGVVHAVSVRRLRTGDMERIRYLTLHDELTTLYNLRYLKQRLDEEMLRAERYKHPLGVLYVDLDRMKQVNDTYGHRAGDRVLRGVAGILKETCRSTDLLGRAVGRIGGDEFVIILPETSLEESHALARRVIQAINDVKVDVGTGGTLSVGVSIGIAIFPEAGGDRETVLERADAAMYRAKQAGGNSFADIRGYLCHPLAEKQKHT